MENLKIEIKKSKTNLSVPIVNGIHLHSIYDPETEAQTILNKYKESIEKNSHALIFGLGFAYHIIELIKQLERFHGDDFKILVIEPNLDLVDQFKNQSVVLKNTEIIVNTNAEDNYTNEQLVEFLMDSPTIINHPPSFNLNKEYFTAFMKYRSPENLNSYIKNINEEAYQSYLESWEGELSLWKNIEKIKLNNNRKLTQKDYILIAFDSIANEVQ